MGLLLAGVAEEDGDVAASIRWRDGLPLAFLHDGRLYMVRRIDEQTSGRFRLVAAAGRSGPFEPFEIRFDPATGAWSVVRLPGEAT